jgi:SecD/SecF fusion protein
MTDRQRHGFILLLVAGLIAASFVFIATRKTRLGLDLKGGVELVYKAEKTAVSPVNPASLQRAVDVMNNRVNQLGVTQPQITTEGKNLIDVQLPDVKNVVQAEKAVGTTAQLFFYDWEANALTPTGQPVADGLVSGDAAATAISQGSQGNAGSPSPASGAMGFYQAVQLASKQPLQTDIRKTQGTGNQFFLFGAPGSSACAAYATAQGTKVQKGVHCLIAETQVADNASYASAVRGLKAGLSRAEKAGTQVLEVKQGWQVLQAVPTNYATQPNYGSPNAGYYVLRDDVALRGNQITNPMASTDQSGAPDVTFGFQGNGGNLFQNVTRNIAVRGLLDSSNQHFAIALNNQLVSVPNVQYKEFGDGILRSARA